MLTKKTGLKLLALFALTFLLVTNSSMAQKSVDIVLCQSISTPSEYQGDITPNDVTSKFPVGTEDRHNIWVVAKFQPFGKSVGLRFVVTKDTPDGKFEQDRVLSINSTEHNAATSYQIMEKGKYCLRVVDEFDDKIIYSDDHYFTVE